MSMIKPVHTDMGQCYTYDGGQNATKAGMYMAVLSAQGPFLLTWLSLIPAWISNHRHRKVGDELTYFNSATIEVWEWISNFIQRFMIDVITYPCSD